MNESTGVWGTGVQQNEFLCGMTESFLSLNLQDQCQRSPEVSDKDQQQDFPEQIQTGFPGL